MFTIYFNIYYHIYLSYFKLLQVLSHPSHPILVSVLRFKVRLDFSNLKAWFRGAQASEVLGLAEQGLKFCHGALKLDPKDCSLTAASATVCS